MKAVFYVTFEAYECVIDEDFRSDRIVSKLVAVIVYKTRYEAAKIERTCVFYLTVGNKLEVPKTKGFDKYMGTVLRIRQHRLTVILDQRGVG